MIKKITTLLFTCLLIPAMANPLASPARCPAVTDIKALDLPYVEDSAGLGYLFYNISNYNTSNSWVFGLFVFDASNQEDARVKADNALSNLSGQPVPTKDPDSNEWLCSYTPTEGTFPVAITMENSFAHSQSLLRELIQSSSK